MDLRVTILALAVGAISSLIALAADHTTAISDDAYVWLYKITLLSGFVAILCSIYVFKARDILRKYAIVTALVATYAIADFSLRQMGMGPIPTQLGF